MPFSSRAVSRMSRKSKYFLFFNASISPSLSWQNIKAKTSRVVRNRLFTYAKTKAVTAQLISAFIFATRIVQSLCFLNPKFQASSHLLWLYIPICVGPGRKTRRPVFSQQCSINRRYLKSSIFEMCIISTFILLSFKSK